LIIPFHQIKIHIGNLNFQEILPNTKKLEKKRRPRKFKKKLNSIYLMEQNRNENNSYIHVVLMPNIPHMTEEMN
jgi:hypothetical protein